MMLQTMKYVIVSISKFKLLIILLTLSLLLVSNPSYGKNNCEQIKFDTKFQDVDQIEIKFDDYRRWTTNGLRILSFKEQNIFIPSKFKKRFKANIIVHYKDKNICTLRSRIRQSGDHYDHIKFKNGNINQSLDVHLDEYNIFGSTKFKLFLPSTRNSENEIFLSYLLSELGYLSPKTSFIKVNINGNLNKFIFQEKAAKELVENLKFKDAPIYEGNENLIVGTSLDKNLVFNKKLTFAKQVNTNWIKSDLRKKISVEGLTKLNFAYFTNISKQYEEYSKSDQLTLDYKHLSNNDKNHLDYLNIYDAIINSTDSGHALIPHNRKFYFDPFTQKFYPIFYDGSAGTTKRYIFGGWKPKILKLNVNENEFKWGVSQNAIDGAKNALIKIDQIDKDKFYKDLKFKGVEYKEVDFKNIFDAINHNLIEISKIEKKRSKDISKIDLQDYLNFANKSSKDYKVFFTKNENSYICNNNIKKCKLIEIGKKKFRELIEGEFVVDKNKVLFLGELSISESEKFLFNINKIRREYSEQKFQINGNEIKVKSSNNVKFSIKESNRLLDITASKDDWVVIYDSFLDNIKISIKYDLESDQSSLNPKEDRFNEYFLTGCMNIFNSQLKELEIEVQNTSCEDALNIINSKGSLAQVNITNSSFDGLDIDFSEIDINYLSVKNAGNDCSDFSFGKHKIDIMNLYKCGDKGVSVGEKTLTYIEKLKVKESNIGVASKDSSEVFINNSQISQTDSCISVYNKKDEFDGGRVSVSNFSCLNSNKKIVKDDFSIVKIEKEI